MRPYAWIIEKSRRTTEKEDIDVGDVSIIARRLEGGTRVQYGWSGNGGYFRSVGAKLIAWYQAPQNVEYLFGLGQLKHIGKPGSENGGEP